MEKIFKLSKWGIIAILTLRILLCTAGNGMHAAIEEDTTVDTDETIVTTEDTTVVTEENTQELMPMMARWCDENEYSTRIWNSLAVAQKYGG